MSITPELELKKLEIEQFFTSLGLLKYRLLDPESYVVDFYLDAGGCLWWSSHIGHDNDIHIAKWGPVLGGPKLRHADDCKCMTRDEFILFISPKPDFSNPSAKFYY